jgi:secondary thiamine-phosphate synthase enzyme
MHTQTYDVRTHHRSEMVDITGLVLRTIGESGVRDGLVNVYVPHTTAGVTINENADPDVVHDMLAALDAAVPWRQDFYQHGEGNSAAHVKSSMVGCSMMMPFHAGRPALGTWQGVYFCEFDGPRTRQVVLSVLGDADATPGPA